MEQYLKLLETIQKEGTYKPAAREGMPGTQSLFGFQFRHNLQNGFPLLTTKKMFWKGVVVELLWFLKGGTNIKFLVDNGVNIWNEDAYQYYCKLCTIQNVKNKISFEQFIDIIKNCDNGNGLNVVKYPEIVSNIDDYIPKDYYVGDCGYQYGKVWRNWQGDCNVEIIDVLKVYHKNYAQIDQISNVINSIRRTPESRRHLVTALDPAHENDLALYWCHAMFQFNCRPLTAIQREDCYAAIHKYTEEQRMEMNPNASDSDVHVIMDSYGIPRYVLDCQLYQRSADVFLGVPFNIASYALLTHIIAKMSNMVPGDFIHTFGDVHIYDNHKNAVETQLSRVPGEHPTLSIKDVEEIDWTQDIDSLISSIESHGWEDIFKIENYNPQSAIKAELSTGLKKN